MILTLTTAYNGKVIESGVHCGFGTEEDLSDKALRALQAGCQVEGIPGGVAIISGAGEYRHEYTLQGP